MKVICFGAGDMAIKGIEPVLYKAGHDVLQLPHSSCDVRILEEVESKMRIKPDAVVVTAGVSHPSTVKDSQPFQYRNEIETNLLGAFNVARAAVKEGVKTLVFIASVAGMHGKPNHAAYSASKGGVISLVQSLSFEGVNAYAISPGRVNTIMRQRDYPNDTPGSRLEPREVGEVIKDVLDGKYEPGDNLIIRKIGFETQPVKVDKGPWRKELKVGEPVTI